MKKNIILTVLAAVALPALGLGSVLVQTDAFSFVPSASQELTFNQFDLSLGTLQSIQVSVTLSKAGGYIQADNDSLQSGMITLTHQVKGSLSSSDVYLDKSTGHGQIGSVGSLNATSVFTTNMGATTGDSTFDFNAQPGSSDYVNYSPASTTVSTSGFIAQGSWGADAANNIKGFLGFDTFAVLVNAAQIATVSGLGGISEAFVPSLTSGNVTVTFTYDAKPVLVPEPGALAALLALGMLSVGTQLRQPKSKRIGIAA